MNDGLPVGEEPFDLSIERQKAAVAILNNTIKKLIQLCKEDNRAVPTQIKLVYDVSSHRLNADYQYEPIYSKDETKTAFDVLEEWIQSESKNIEAGRPS